MNDTTPPEQSLRIGELAEATGVTVRTLHHYDQIALLKPSAHTEGGHRLYTTADILRLQTIVALKAQGFSLDVIGSLLEDNGGAPTLALIEAQLQLVTQSIERLSSIRDQLTTALAVLGERKPLGLAELLLTVKAYSQAQQPLTPAEISALVKSRTEFWAALDVEVRNQMFTRRAASFNQLPDEERAALQQRLQSFVKQGDEGA